MQVVDPTIALQLYKTIQNVNMMNGKKRGDFHYEFILKSIHDLCRLFAAEMRPFFFLLTSAFAKIFVDNAVAGTSPTLFGNGDNRFLLLNSNPWLSCRYPTTLLYGTNKEILNFDVDLLDIDAMVTDGWQQFSCDVVPQQLGATTSFASGFGFTVHLTSRSDTSNDI